jgi:two-component system sensor histidine kinase/response regulator
VSVRAKVVSISTSVTLELVVADNGIGMDTETQSRLFTPFTQADHSTTRRFGGTGLGLAITHMLVRLMDGEITVQSALQRGSVFTVRLDFARAKTTRVGNEALPSVLGLQCLIAGSGADQTLADDLSAYLEYGGAVVARFSSLAEALVEHQGHGLWLWLILPGQMLLEIADLRTQTARSPNRQSRFIVFGRGRRRWPRVEEIDLVSIDVDMLLRRTLYKAVALAAGHASVEDGEQNLALVKPQNKAPARHVAKEQKRLILVAEDNETNRIVIRHQLESIGFASEIVSNGQEALEKWRTGDFSLVLTDLHMPELDGYGLTSAIRAEEVEGFRTPIIALTANAVRDEQLRCTAAGMDVYLTKPIPTSFLKESLEAWLCPAAACEQSGPVESASGGTAPCADLSVLRALVGDDEVAIDEVLKVFRAGAEESRADLRRAIANGSCKSVSATAHKFKSAARSIGASRLGELCADVELLADAGQSDKLLMALPSLEAELGVLLSFLASR